MKVSIIGGGHTGYAMAAHLSYLGYQALLWNRTETTIHPLRSCGKVKVTGIINETVELDTITCDMQQAMEYSNIIFVTVPSNAHKDIAKNMLPYINSDHMIILAPGRTFGALEFRQILNRSNCPADPRIAELQSTLYTCRKHDSTTVQIITMKDAVHMFELPCDRSEESCLTQELPQEIRPLLIPTKSMAHTSFGNVGMIIHSAPTLLNAGWIESPMPFKYYYEGITPTVAAFIEKMDTERVQVTNMLGYQIETVTEWMRRVYKVHGKSLYECIQNNAYYETIDAPQDLNHRYLFEDVPCGLVPLEYIASHLDIPTPHISMIIDLANALLDQNFRETGRKIPAAEVFDMLKQGDEVPAAL